MTVEHAGKQGADDVPGMAGVIAVIGQRDAFDQLRPASPGRQKLEKEQERTLPGHGRIMAPPGVHPPAGRVHRPRRG